MRALEAEREKLAVGLVIDRFDAERGGAERALADLGRGLARRGHRVVVACASAERARPFDGVELVLVPGRRGFPRGRAERALGARLVRAAEDAGCDVVVGVRHLARVDVLWPHGGAHAVTLAALRSARAGRELPPRAPAPWSRHYAFLALERAALEGGARRVVCVSELVRAEFAALHPSAARRLVRVDNAVDLERFHPRERARAGFELRRALGVDAETALVVCAARNPELKGVPVLFDALARLAKRASFPKWTCVVAGPKDAREWERRASALGLEGRVLVLEHADAVALASAADLAVLPTWRDTCGLFVLEALACGTPAITTARAGAAETLGLPDAGSVLARPGDADALARELAAWIERARGPRAELHRAAARAAVTNRGLEAWLDAFEALFALVRAEKRAEGARA